MKLIAPPLLSRRSRPLPEKKLLAVVVLLLLFAVAGPFVAQPADYHDFADHRTFWSIPFAMDVLSNLPFALWGAAGLWLARRPWGAPSFESQLAVMQRRMAQLFFAGLLITAACSSWYHWQPDNSGLLVDRCGMVFAFAGLLGLAAAGRVGARAGAGLAATVLLLGMVSVLAWFWSGNLTPWLVLQFGGMALILWFAGLSPLEGALQVRWGLVMLIYAVAKILELFDHQVYEMAGHLVSGHSLKHLVASAAAWPVVAALLHNKNEGRAR